MEKSPLEKILTFLEEKQITYDLMEHKELGFSSQEVAEARKVELGACSKAVVLKYKGNGKKGYVLAVLPGDEKINTEKLASFFGAKKANFASHEDVLTLTSCVSGALAPFSFNEELNLVIDPSLFERFEKIAFNAGSLQHTIVMKSEDYRNIAKAQEFSFIL